VAEEALERTAEAQDEQMERTATRADLRIARDITVGCVSSDSHHRIYVPGSAHGVTVGSFLVWVLSCCFVWDASPAISRSDGNCSGWA
jgi:hypothetical protein